MVGLFSWNGAIRRDGLLGHGTIVRDAALPPDAVTALAAVRVLDAVPRVLAAGGYEAFTPGRELVRRRPQVRMKVVFVADSRATVGAQRDGARCYSRRSRPSRR